MHWHIPTHLSDKKHVFYNKVYSHPGYQKKKIIYEVF